MAITSCHTTLEKLDPNSSLCVNWWEVFYCCPNGKKKPQQNASAWSDMTGGWLEALHDGKQWQKEGNEEKTRDQSCVQFTV